MTTENGSSKPIRAGTGTVCLTTRERTCSYFALKTRLAVAPATPTCEGQLVGLDPSAISSSGVLYLHVDLQVRDGSGRIEAVGQGVRPLLDLSIGEVGPASLDR